MATQLEVSFFIGSNVLSEDITCNQSMTLSTPEIFNNVTVKGEKSFSISANKDEFFILVKYIQFYCILSDVITGWILDPYETKLYAQGFNVNLSRYE